MKEWYKKIEEEMTFARKLFLEKLYSSLNTSTSNVGDFRIKIRWKVKDGDQTNGGYNYDNLHKIFSKVIIFQFYFSLLLQMFLIIIFLQYGDIVVLVVSSKKKGSALVEFGDKSAAVS